MKKHYTFSVNAGYWNKILHKFYNLQNKITKLIFSNGTSKTQINLLLERLKKLFRKLSRIQTKAGVKIAGSALALLMATTSLNAQDYISKGHLKYNSFMNMEFPSPDVIDFDGNGKPDLIFGTDNNFIPYFEFESDGSFNLIDSIRYNGNPLNFNGVANDFADLDGDGDIDMILGINSNMYNLYNDGTGNLTGVQQVDANGNPINLQKPNPKLFDFDNDGDLDLFVGEYYGYVIYYQKDATGYLAGDTLMTADSAMHVMYYAAPDIVDIDNDGDFDLIAGNYFGTLNVFFNDGSGNFTDGGYLQADGDILKIGYVSDPEFADVDGDGDMDLILGGYIYSGGDYGWGVELYLNDGNNNFTFDKKLFYPVGEINNGTYASVKFFDIDNDGDEDLFTGNINSNYIFEYTNYKNNLFFADTLRDSTGALISVSHLSDPEFADLDGDGNFDLYIGSRNGLIAFYKNYGDNKFMFEGNLTTDGNTIDVGSYSTPDFEDIDNDGDMDLFVGGYYYIHFYENTGNGVFTGDSLVQADGNPINISYSVPEFEDYDNDGDLDLLVGSYPSGIYKFKNEGNGVFSSDGMLDVQSGNYPHPEVVDFTSTCSPDIFIADGTGFISFYQFTDNTAPIPDTTILPVIIEECSATLTAPTATDNCDSTVIGTTNDPLTYSEQGNYIVTWEYTDNSGNTAYQQQIVQISDVTNPEITCISDTTVVADNSNTFTVTDGSLDYLTATDNCGVDTVYNSYNNTSTLSGEILNPGVYNIIWFVKDFGGNLNYSTSTITVNPYVGLNDLAQLGISAYPNPVTDFLNIKNAKGYSLKIIDLKGLTVKSAENIDGDLFKVDVKNLSKGMYILQIYNDNIIKNAKIVIE